MKNLSLIKKFASLLIPIKIEEANDIKGNKMSLFYFQKNFILQSGKAIYSNGMKYKPFLFSFEKIYSENILPKTFLLLGAGMGSALEILQKKYHCFPNTTIVDIDFQTIQWMKKYINFKDKQSINYQCVDANEYVNNTTKTYDLIGVDIFYQLKNIEFIFENYFIDNLKKILNPNGWLIFNIIENEKQKIEHFEMKLKEKFQIVKIYQNNENIFFIIKKD